MKTEISELNKALQNHRDLSNTEEWIKADIYLRKMRKKYGTTDPNFIQYLTR